MSLLTPAIRRRAFEQGSADALFRRKGRASRISSGLYRVSAWPESVELWADVRAEEPAKGRDQEVTQGAPGSHSQMMGSGHGLNVLVESWRHP